MYKLLISIILSAIIFAGGGWTKEKGKAFLKYELRLINAKKYYDFDSEQVDISKTSYISNSLYAEYGLLHNFTVNTNLSFKSISTNDGDRSVSGLGDVAVGFKYGIIQDGPTVLAADLGLSFNTGDTNDSLLWTGSGQNNTIFGLSLGHSFYPLDAYLNLGLHYNLRSELDNEIHYNAEFGYKMNQFLAAIKLRGILISGDLNRDIIRSAFYQTEYHAYSLELNYFIQDNLGLTIAMDGAFKVKNNFAAAALSFGVFTEF